MSELKTIFIFVGIIALAIVAKYGYDMYLAN